MTRSKRKTPMATTRFHLYRRVLAALVAASLSFAVSAQSLRAQSTTDQPATETPPALLQAGSLGPVETARGVLAPTGVLRIGVYLGSPSSLVRSADGSPRGVTVDLGRALAQRLGVAAQLVEFERLAAVLDALKVGQVDMTVTNATAARAEIVDFTAPILSLELGYLVPAGSRINSIAQVDQAGVRIGVSQGSSSQAALTRQLKQATIVPAASLQIAAQMLQTEKLDAFATNKAILFELADQLSSATLLPGRWGLEHMAIGIPKGRDAGRPLLAEFAQQIRHDGSVQRAADRAGLRGTADTAVQTN